VITLYQWFARSVRRYPDTIALEVGDRALTYRELDACSADVAAYLLRTHGTPPRRVGLLASRSLIAFAGYLGVTRLGATVLPLNPAYPLARNRLMLEAAPCDVVLDDSVEVGTTGDVPDDLSALDDVAYLLFTSGSTGRPKGVPIKHRHVSPFIEHNIARFEVGPGARLSHTFDLTFDPSVFDLFVAWGSGATLVCPQRTELLDPLRYIADRRLTHWYSVPSVITTAERLGTLGRRVTGLHHSAFIGEQLTLRQAARWHAAAPSVITNTYGPTELTIACADYRLPADRADWPATSNDTVPIGSPYPFLAAAVQDGELCVRGPQRFDGYLNPLDDAGRFTADGHYRTGDRVQWEQGRLVHLGRTDHQVKISGYRVELGEIETVLGRHPDVADAVVIASTVDGSVRLDAWYRGAEVPERELTRWLRGRLPLHMVPRRFRHMAQFPLNANGKTDRAALALEASR